jgi:hypothetical protein
MALVYIISGHCLILYRFDLNFLVLLQMFDTAAKAPSTQGQRDEGTDVRGPDVHIYTSLSELEEVGDEFRLEICAKDGIAFPRDITIQALHIASVSGS